MAKIIGSTPTKTIERVCVSKSSKEQICLLCTEVITDKDFSTGGPDVVCDLHMESKPGKV